MTAKALDGVKVVAFEHALAGPMTTSILGSYGATVVRIETATRLDWHRQSGPFIGNLSVPNRSACYLFVNSSKHAVTLNLKKPEGMAIVRRILQWADVVVENFAGGVMDKMGLGYEDLKKLNPGIIMLGAAIFGQTGPYATVKGHGGPLTALTGFPHITGFPDQLPQFPGFVLTDFTAPRASVLAIVAALDYRRRTGQGQYLDASQFESAIHIISPILLQYNANGTESERQGNRNGYSAPHGLYKCKDGKWCAITVLNDAEWDKFAAAIGSPAWTSDKKFATNCDRVSAQDELDKLVEAWTANFTANEVMEKLQGAGVAAGVVQSGADMENDPQFKARHFYQTMEHPEDIGNFSYSGQPAQMSETPYELTRAPMLGEDNEMVYTKLINMNDEEFVDAMVNGVFE